MGSDHQDPSGHMKTSSTSPTVWSQPGGKRIQIENVRRRCPPSRTFPERNPVKIPTERKKRISALSSSPLFPDLENPSKCSISKEKYISEEFRKRCGAPFFS